MTAPASAHPRTVEDLLPDAKALTAKLGKTPPRNHLMKELRIGAPKATALIERLTAKPAIPVYDYPEPIGPDPAPTPAVPESTTEVAPDPTPAEPATVAETSPLVAVDGHPGSNITTTEPDTTPAKPREPRRPVAWPVLLLALPAFVAIWSGWVELGELAGFGVVNPLPGIWDDLSLNTAITLPIGVETYAAYAMWVWLSGRAPGKARRFAKWSALGSLVVGAAGQVAYHLMTAAGMTAAPWWITTAVACLPVVVLGMGAALAHLLHSTDEA
ncbi:ABC transporter permease [Polymorphospora rubra]|uniref:ABC transporter permease n=1 Tax=Polymorphospora rubra TaxID=338584 RepID=A0A810MZ57_9ACTN|nr:ABC transporter permease [Polymorphospora rubra]BCJ65880.1 ABC transporter permease [Polymorphospora rubra]